MGSFAIKSPGASYGVESSLNLGLWIGELGAPFVVILLESVQWPFPVPRRFRVVLLLGD